MAQLAAFSFFLGGLAKRKKMQVAKRKKKEKRPETAERETNCPLILGKDEVPSSNP